MDVHDVIRVVVYGLPASISQYYQVETQILCKDMAKLMNLYVSSSLLVVRVVLEHHLLLCCCIAQQR